MLHWYEPPDHPITDNIIFPLEHIFQEATSWKTLCEIVTSHIFVDDELVVYTTKNKYQLEFHQLEDFKDSFFSVINIYEIC